YERADDWWNKGGDLYALERLQAEGFAEIQDEPQRGDMIVMQIRAPVPNHAGVYLGEGQMLHHLADRLSGRVPYGGYW
ncbi:NlpC/P60 family protein, partial [Xanthomonas euvesicatoria]